VLESWLRHELDQEVDTEACSFDHEGAPVVG